MARVCSEVGLSLEYDYVFDRSLGSVPVSIRCGKSIQQIHAEKPTDGESIGGAVVGAAAIGGGVYLLGKMIE